MKKAMVDQIDYDRIIECKRTVSKMQATLPSILVGNVNHGTDETDDCQILGVLPSINRKELSRITRWISARDNTRMNLPRNRKPDGYHHVPLQRHLQI